MKCIIVGVGKVGYALAGNLCAEGHEVTVIDSSRRRLNIMEEHFNVSVIEGNAARLDTLKEAGVANADLLIAVTDKDELNMVACFVAKNAGASATIARVRNPAYSDFDDKARLDALGIDMIINPEKICAEEIVRLLEHPEAHYVGFYGSGTVQMLELRMPRDSRVLGMPLHQLDLPAPCVIAAMERDEQLIIPKGWDHLQENDEILVLAYTADMPAIEEYLGIHSKRPRSVMIFGGSLSGYYLAQMLERRTPRLNVKLIEPNMERCEEMAQSLNHTVVINGGGSDVNLYSDENVGDTDIFIAAGGDDKENLFACVLARSMGAGRTISQIRGPEYAALIEKVGVDKVVSPTGLTADRILRFIDRKHILSLTRFNDSPGQITEYMIPEGARCIGVPLMKLGFPQQALICMITRGDRHIIAGGSDSMNAGDTVLVFSMPEAIDKVERLLTVEGEDK